MYFSRFFYFRIITRFLKGNLYKYRKKKNGHNFLQVGYFKWKKIFVINSIFLYCNLNPNSGLRHSIKSSLIEFLVVSNFTICHELGTASTNFFYNLAPFSIYGEDETTISRRGEKFREISLRKKVQKGNPF